MRFGDAIRRLGRMLGGASNTGPAGGAVPPGTSRAGLDPAWRDGFRTAVKEGAARAFQAIRADHPDEQMYVFALYSEDAAMTVCPAANSEEAYARKSRDANPARRVGLRWNTGDWAYEFEHVEMLDGAYRMLIDLRESIGEMEFLESDAPEDVFRTMVAALEELNAEGFFGTGEARERVTVFFTLSDGGEEWEAYSAPRCNPPAVAERFLREVTPG